MNERINWVDWGKAIAVVTVVFCHLPQSQEWFYYRYLQACTITIFFFLSGYLKKDRDSDKENWRKYWNSLIIPYLLYNAIVYPYWLIRFYLQNGGFPDFMQAMKPIIGALLLEHESSFAEPLNGPLWYLPAILIMHIIIDFCRKTRYLHQIMIGLCVISFFLYAANIQWQFMHNMTPMGLFRRLPYYYLGYVMGQQRLFQTVRPLHNALTSICLLLASLLFFYWHLHEDRTLPHAILFYPVNICFLFCILYLCKALDHFTPKYITNISIGTLVIFVNNAIYGMTGGQMAPTTLIGQKTATCPYGRDPKLHGYPLKMADIAAGLEGTCYVTRQSVESVASINKAKKALKKAFQASMDGKGSSLVEFVSTCNSGWKLTPAQANEWMKENMFPFYPKGDLKDTI